MLWSNDREMPYNFAFESFLNDSYVAVCDIDEFDELADSDSTQVVNFYATPEYLD